MQVWYDQSNYIFSRYDIEIPILPVDLDSYKINVKMDLKMKNSKNYVCKQIFYIEFAKLKGIDNQWEICKNIIVLKK